MDEDVLDKFVANMRAAGQSDEMIADSLIGAGHSELIVLNALGVEHMSQLSAADTDDDPTPAPAAAPAQSVATSAYIVMDADGNPLISEDNLPKAVGEVPAETTTPAQPPAQPVQPQQQPASVTAEAPAKKAVINRNRPPRGRSYPRPAAHRISERPTRPQMKGFISQTKAVAPAERPQPNLQQLGREGIAAKKDEETKKPVEPESKPTLEVKPRKSTVTPSPKKFVPAKKKTYGHHSYDFFMNRVESHKELEASSNHTLEANTIHKGVEVPEQRNHIQDVASPNLPKMATAEKPAKPMPTAKKEEKPPEPQGPGSIDELLVEQKEEAAAGPGGPDMDDLLDAKDLEDLRNTPEEAPPADKKAVDLKAVHQAPEIARAGGLANDIRNSLTVKIVVILIGVLSLVALTSSIISQIKG